MKDLITAITPNFHPDLISTSALSAMETLAENLPDSFPYGLLECRLGAEQFQVDFQVTFPRSILNLPSNFVGHTTWEILHSLSQNWVDSSSFLYANINRIGLEFDINKYSGNVPIPCIFLGLKTEATLNENNLFKIVNQLFSHQISPKLEMNIQHCLNTLPAGAKIRHIGAMLSRKPATLRVNIGGISPQEIIPYLQELGYATDTDSLVTLIADVSELVDSILLSIDVSEIIYPRIGLECFLFPQPHQDSSWENLFKYLVDQGLSTQEKKAALWTWPGFSQPKYPPSFTNLSDLFFPGNRANVIWRTINHIKLVYHPQQPLEAKAYLAFAHCQIDRKYLTV